MARILILEDDRDLAEAYRFGIEAAGHAVLGVFEAPAPLLACADALERPDLVIVDEELGADSGTAALAALRAAFPGARLLLVSSDAKAVADARGLGFDGARLKPCFLRGLAEEIGGLLARGPGNPFSA
jgi:DNA-binding response OmpR family regulator